VSLMPHGSAGVRGQCQATCTGIAAEETQFWRLIAYLSIEQIA